MELRDYQKTAVDIGVNYFLQKNPIPSIIVEPVAAGKSIIISAIAKKTMEINKEAKFLCIQPSIELLNQNYEKLKLLGGEASIYSASLSSREIGDITYATIGSIKNIPNEFKGYYVICDEIHLYPKGAGMLRNFLKEAKISHVLGFTATPLKLQTLVSFDGFPYSKLVMLTTRNKHGLFFKDIIHLMQIKDIVNKGYWADLIYETYGNNSCELIYNSTKAEFTEESINLAYSSNNIEDRIIERLNTLMDRKSILIAVPSVEICKRLEQRIIGSKAVWGDMDKKERNQVISDFKLLKIRVVINVNVLSTGFDHPQLDCFICARETASLALYYQMIGRITRPHPTKKNGLIIDFTGNYDRFGDIRNLEYIFEDEMWKLYNNGKLVSGVPIHEIGQHTTETEEKKRNKPPILDFGKYKGQNVLDTPEWYKNWLSKEFRFTPSNIHIKKALKNDKFTVN